MGQAFNLPTKPRPVVAVCSVPGRAPGTELTWGCCLAIRQAADAGYFFSSAAGGAVSVVAGAGVLSVIGAGSVFVTGVGGFFSAQPSVENPRPARAISISNFFMIFPRKSFWLQELHQAGHPCRACSII